MLSRLLLGLVLVLFVGVKYARAQRTELTFSTVDPLHIARLRRAVSSTLPLNGLPATAYMINMSIGTPPQSFSMLCDTGSSNLAVAGSASVGVTPYYQQSASSTATTSGDTISTQYLQGSWSANRVSDVVSVGGIPPVTTEFASIYQASDFFNSQSSVSFQGIFGLAFAGLANPQPNPVTPLFDVWVADGLVLDSFGMQLCDPTTTTNANGNVVLNPTPSFIDFGATEADITDLANGAFVYSPLVEKLYYEVTVVDMALGGQSLGLACSVYNSPTPGVVDSGTTELLVPQAAYNAIVSYLSNVISVPSNQQSDFFNGNECVVLQRSDVAQLPSITISLMGSQNTAFDLIVPPWHYLRVLEVDGQIPPGSECRAFSVAPTCGTVMGVAMMSGYTVLFDRANSRMGFAPSTCSASSGFTAIPPITTRAANTTCPSFSACSSCDSLFSQWAVYVGAITLVLLSMLM